MCFRCALLFFFSRDENTVVGCANRVFTDKGRIVEILRARKQERELCTNKFTDAIRAENSFPRRLMRDTQRGIGFCHEVYALSLFLSLARIIQTPLMDQTASYFPSPFTLIAEQRRGNRRRNAPDVFLLSFVITSISNVGEPLASPRLRCNFTYG